jgi:hypothetical protein
MQFVFPHFHSASVSIAFFIYVGHALGFSREQRGRRPRCSRRQNQLF